MTVNKLQLGLIATLLLVLPIHTMLIANIIGLPVLQIWKEAIIVLLLGLFFLNYAKTKKFGLVDFFLIITITYFVFITSLSLFSLSSLYGLRNLILPIVVLLITKNVKVSEKWFRSLLKHIIVISVLISLFGIWQFMFVGDQFLLDLGYSEGSDGRLHHSFYFAGGIIQRNIATFSSPNDFGFFLILVIILLDYYRLINNKWVFRLFNLILHTSLLLTFSRSAFLGLAIYYLLNNPKRTFEVLGLTIIIIILTNYYYLDLLISVKRFVALTLSGEDPSIKGHIDSLIYSFGLVKENLLFGLEMGRVGPRATLFFKNMIDVESSFFCLILDVGIIGFILYITPIIILMKNKLVLLMMISVTPMLFLLPMIYELEVMICLFGFVGLISVKKNETKKLDIFKG